MIKEDTPPAQRRLNPFAFPPETNAFFTLLTLTAPVWMLELGQILNNSLRQNIFSSINLMLLVILLAAILYLLHPARIRYSKKLRLLTRMEDPKFVDAIQELTALSQVSSPPRIEMAADSRTVDGQAFGLWRNYSLRLGGRLRLLFRQDPPSFRAIILHELAHIANADISRAYITRAIWNSVVFLTVLPFTGLIAYYFFRVFINQSNTEMVSIVLLSLLKIGGALMIITAIYSNLLRSREFYADWRAALWGAGQALEKILRRNDEEAAKPKRRISTWRLHPTARERIEVLQHPDRLLVVKPTLGFYIGVLPGLMVGSLLSESSLFLAFLAVMGAGLEQLFGSSLFNSEWSIVLIAFMAFTLLSIPGFILTYLITNSLGLAVQRESIAGMSAGLEGWRSYLALCKPAILAAVGFQAGSLLTVSSILEIVPGLFQSQVGRFFLLLILVITVTFAFLTWAGLIYVSSFARQLLGSHAGRSLPKGKMFILTLVLSGVLTIFYVPLVFAQEIIQGAASGGDTSMLFQWLLAVILAEVIAISLFVLVFLVTWLMVGIYRLLHKMRCPDCGQITRQQYAVGNLCENCGRELAPWLYIT